MPEAFTPTGAQALPTLPALQKLARYSGHGGCSQSIPGMMAEVSLSPEKGKVTVVCFVVALLEGVCGGREETKLS